MMATALQSFRVMVRSCHCGARTERYLSRSITQRRAFATTRELLEDLDTRPSTRRQQEASNDFDSDGDVDWAAISKFQKAIESLPDDHPMKPYKEMYEHRQFLDQSGMEEEVSSEVKNWMADQGLLRPEVRKKKKLKETFLNMGDPEPFEDTDFEMESDTLEEMNSLAHGELERHREMRHYARLAAWEMPLLSKFAKPFEPPTQHQPLRFRYTSYMGEQHPAEKKVVLEFCTLDMPDLTRVQRSKLIKLAGVRYNPQTDIVKMSCEMFPSQAQNKRYLGVLVNDMLSEARDPTDTFEDVPYDMRHHKFKPKPMFPTSWKMTKERQKELAELRANAELTDQRRLLTGQLVDGIKQIEEAFSKAAAQPVSIPEMVMAGKGIKGRGKKVAVRR